MEDQLLNVILDSRNKNWDGGYLYYPFLHSTVELGWRVSVLPIPALHCTLCTCNT